MSAQYHPTREETCIAAS